MKYICLTFVCSLSFLFIPQSTFAYDAKVSPDISIGEEYVSEKNIYLASLHTWFGATHKKDLTSVSIDQTISGSIFGDILLFGKNLSIIGETFGDVRVVGDTVVISGVINEDLVVLARHVEIASNAIINGDTLIMAHTVEAQGQFLGESQITASRISVTGSIIGPTTLTGSKISFLGGSKVLSEVSYFSPQRAFIEQGAQIQKELNFNQVEFLNQSDVAKRLFFGFVSFWAIIKLIATLFVIFVLTHIFKIFTQRIIDIVQLKKLPTFGLGIATLFGMPLLIVTLFGSLVLIPVSIIVAALFTIMIILLPSVSAIIGASFYQKYIQKKSKMVIDFNLSALLLIGITFIGFIPYIGNIIVYALYILSLGAMIRYLYEQVRRKNVKL